MTKMMKCNCTSEFQDTKYGKGVRAFNSCQKPAKPSLILAWRCTVCAKEVPA